MYKRILLKLSGESLMGSQSHGIDPQRLQEYAQQIKAVHEMGVQIGIVIGGGNFFRGLSGAHTHLVALHSVETFLRATESAKEVTTKIGRAHV